MQIETLFFFSKKEKPVFCFHIVHLQQRARAIRGLLGQQDEHAELLLHVWQLQDLHTVFRDVVVGQLLHLVHHLDRLALILSYQQSTIKFHLKNCTETVDSIKNATFAQLVDRFPDFKGHGPTAAIIFWTCTTYSHQGAIESFWIYRLSSLPGWL